MTRLDALDALERVDPDGQEQEPTPAARARFRAYALERFGADMWREYRAGGWGSTPDI